MAFSVVIKAILNESELTKIHLFMCSVIKSLKTFVDGRTSFIKVSVIN